jgi:prepilin-type processing-associated H-X9-DG protein
MTSQTPDNHILEEIPMYLAGGLTIAERERFDAHVQSCPECSAALLDARTMDDTLATAFKNTAPADDFEDRLIARFRQKTTATTLHPMVRRAAIGVAAAILLGAVGLGVNQKIDKLDQGRFAFDSQRSERGAAVTEYVDVHNAFQGGSSYRSQGQNVLYGDGHVEPLVVQRRAAFIVDRNSVAPTDQYDSVLLPTDNGPAPQGAKKFEEREQAQQNDEKVRLPVSASTPVAQLGLKGANTYIGGTVINGGTLDVDGDGIADLRRAPSGGGRGGGASGGFVELKSLDAVHLGTNGTAPNGVESNSGLPTQSELAKSIPLTPNDIAGKFQDRLALAAVNTQDSPPAPIASPSAAPANKDDADQSGKPAPAQTEPPPPPQENLAETRKIIRQGEMSFEVDSFDSTVMNIGKIVAEEGGFVSTTDSDKLANGKVQGTVVLRVPPQNLDTLVLKLRGIGDLKSQKISAEDITKQYTDLESELRAAQAMQDRLLDIIKDGKGAVKDLLEAEKQLGVWREKIEQVEGEIRYDNNLISLSTLSVSLIERDIKSAAYSSINEQITMALETEKVEDAYNAAKDAIANAKGQIVQSELKQYEAGQFGATIRALIPPDSADAVVGRLRQLDGRLADFQRQRSESNEGGSAAPLDPAKVKRQDVTLNFTIYNLANIEPRRTTSLTLAASSVEDAYAAILEQASAAGARVVTSNLNRPRPDQSTGTIQLQVPTDKADTLLASFRGTSEIISQETTENPDTQNVTAAKRGFAVQIISLTAMAPRRSTNLTVAVPDVDAAYRLVLDKVAAANGRVVGSGINRGTPEQTNAAINFEVPTDKAETIVTDVRGTGDLMKQDTAENPDLQNTTASKRGFSLQIVALAGVPPRQSEQLQLAAADVPVAFSAILDALRADEGRIIASQLNQQDPTNISGTIAFEISRPARAAIEAAIDQSGEIVSRNLTRSQDTENTVDSKVRVDLTLGSAAQLPPAQTATLGIEVGDVQKAVDDLVNAATAAGGREIDKDISEDQHGRSVAHVIVEVPLDKADALGEQIDQEGHSRMKQVSRNPQAPQGRLARGRFEVTFADASTSLGGEETAWDAIRHGLAVSGQGLRWSMQMIVIGFCFIAPLGLVLWVLWKLWHGRLAHVSGAQRKAE